MFSITHYSPRWNFNLLLNTQVIQGPGKTGKRPKNKKISASITRVQRTATFARFAWCPSKKWISKYVIWWCCVSLRLCGICDRRTKMLVSLEEWYWWKNTEVLKQTCPSATIPQISHRMAWLRTPVSRVRGRRRIAWKVALAKGVLCARESWK